MPGYTPGEFSERAVRQVALLPIERAGAELARRGLGSDEKAVRHIADDLRAQMRAGRTRHLLRSRRGELPAREEYAHPTSG